MIIPNVLRIWLLAGLLLVVCVVMVNVLMDPYLIFGVSRIPSINSIKPAADSEFWLIKAYDLQRYAPKTVLLGSSPIAVGTSARSPSWRNVYKPIYNLATPRSGPYVNYLYLRNAMAMHHISLVVLGLEWSYFLSGDDQGFDSQSIERYLKVTRAGAPNPRELEGKIRAAGYATLSFHALKDSGTELVANLTGDTSDLKERGDYELWKIHDGEHAEPRISIAMDDAWTALNLPTFPWPPNRQPAQKAMSELRAILDLCEAQDTSVVAFITPSYVDLLEMMDFDGYWGWYENWKRGLVSLLSRYPDKPTGDSRATFQLWDFSGYDLYSTEPALSDRQRSRWFLDFAHFRTELGDIIIEELTGEGRRGFGVLLTSENIESHLAEIRQQRSDYRAHHPLETRRLQALRALAPSSAP